MRIVTAVLIAIISSVCCNSVYSADSTLTVFGKECRIQKKDSNSIYLKPISKDANKIIRLRFFPYKTRVMLKSNYTLDSCFFEDSVEIICPNTGKVIISNSFCTKNLLIGQNVESLLSWDDIPGSAENLLNPSVIHLTGIETEYLSLKGLLCDSIIMDSLKYTMLSCLLVNTRSGFNSFGAKKKEIIDKKSRGQFIQMYKCVFLGNSSIEISPDGRIMIENSEISSLRLKADRRIYSYQFSSTETDYGSLSLNSPMIKTQFINSWVRKSLEIENPIRLIALILRKRELRYETMNGWNVNLSNLDSVESRTLISLAGLKMIESSDLYLPIGLKPSQLELNNYSIENTMIHLALDSTDLRNEYVNVGIYFEKLIQYYAENKSLDKDVKERIIERLKYQKALYKAKQISAEPFSISKIFRVTKMKFLKLTVNYGYKGEWQFTKTLLLFIFCWSLAYLFLFSDEVIQYIYVRDEKNEMIETDKENPSFLKLFFMCCWFSFIVFANPKFPSKYFLFSKRMFKWLLIEWFLGLFLLILFLVYIASKYSFIQKLFGF